MLFEMLSTTGRKMRPRSFKLAKTLSLLAIIFSNLLHTANGAQENPVDLAEALEKAVAFAAKGDPSSAVRATNAEARSQKSPKEVLEQAESLKNIYQQLERLGASDGVERLSLKLAGESFLRLKVVDKRAEGAIIWSFVGYRYQGRWYCKDVNINGSDDLMKLMKEELDAADAHEPAPKPSS